MLMTAATVLMVVLMPATFVVLALLVTGWRERRRERRLVHQVLVTEAIDAELGAIVAPVVRRRLGGGWRIEVAVPFEEPALVGQVVALAHAVMRRREGARVPLDVMLTTQMPEVRRANARLLTGAALSPRWRRNGEVMAWTGTRTSRASS